MKQHKKIRICIILIGFIGIIWFALPFVLKGILNIGNVTGLLVACSLLIYGIKMLWINKMCNMLWSIVAGKIIISLISCSIVGIMILTILATTHMIFAAHNTDPNRDVTVVVLGCTVYGDKPSMILKERLDVAVRYLQEYKEVPCILSGGKGPGEDISEAECMYRYLTERGIEEERLYKEDNSTSTRENLLFSKNIIEENEFPETLMIVSNEFHQYRASKIAMSLDMQANAIVAKTTWWLFPTYYVRELYGIVYEWVF